MNDLEQTAIERLKTASGFSLKLYKVPLLIAYSGGKDSDVLLRLAEKSGIPFEVLHSLTTADAPETVYHVRDTFRRLEEKGIRCDVDKHIKPDGTRTTMWNLIPRKLIPPTRLMRYCCAELKEGGGKGRFIATRVRQKQEARPSQASPKLWRSNGADTSPRRRKRHDNGRRRRRWLILSRCISWASPGWLIWTGWRIYGQRRTGRRFILRLPALMLYHRIL